MSNDSEKNTASKLRTVGLTQDAATDWKQILAYEDAKAPAGTRAKPTLVLARILREERGRLEGEHVEDRKVGGT